MMLNNEWNKSLKRDLFNERRINNAKVHKREEFACEIVVMLDNNDYHVMTW